MNTPSKGDQGDEPPDDSPSHRVACIDGVGEDTGGSWIGRMSPMQRAFAMVGGAIAVGLVVVGVSALSSSDDSDGGGLTPAAAPVSEATPQDRCVDDLLSVLPVPDPNVDPTESIFLEYGFEDPRSTFLVGVYARSVSASFQVGLDEAVSEALIELDDYCFANSVDLGY